MSTGTNHISLLRLNSVSILHIKCSLFRFRFFFVSSFCRVHKLPDSPLWSNKGLRRDEVTLVLEGLVESVLHLRWTATPTESYSNRW